MAGFFTWNFSKFGLVRYFGPLIIAELKWLSTRFSSSIKSISSCERHLLYENEWTGKGNGFWLAPIGIGVAGFILLTLVVWPLFDLSILHTTWMSLNHLKMFAGWLYYVCRSWRKITYHLKMSAFVTLHFREQLTLPKLLHLCWIFHLKVLNVRLVIPPTLLKIYLIEIRLIFVKHKCKGLPVIGKFCSQYFEHSVCSLALA